mmetsp:Transcript_20133/g.59625  ORF Transcript_20133/g.59625 Transcript_20133/m.59625 type:complete len:264 (+) Transcript_20133:247-1038(+)
MQRRSRCGSTSSSPHSRPSSPTSSSRSISRSVRRSISGGPLLSPLSAAATLAPSSTICTCAASDGGPPPPCSRRNRSPASSRTWPAFARSPVKWPLTLLFITRLSTFRSSTRWRSGCRDGLGRQAAPWELRWRVVLRGTWPTSQRTTATCLPSGYRARSSPFRRPSGCACRSSMPSRSRRPAISPSRCLAALSARRSPKPTPLSACPPASLRSRLSRAEQQSRSSDTAITPPAMGGGRRPRRAIIMADPRPDRQIEYCAEVRA